MTAIDARERPDTQEMIVAHRVFRREAALLPRLVESVPDGDTERAALIAGHYRDYWLGLHHHHSAEDELLWPLLLARVDLEADLVLRMEAQHEAIAGRLNEVDGAIGAWEAAPSAATAAPVLAAMRAHLAALREHLADEEEHILPMAAEYVTVAEWARLGERFVEETPKDKILFFLGAILEEATPQERARTLANLPVIARIVWYAVGRRQYARRVALIRGGIAASPATRRRVLRTRDGVQPSHGPLLLPPRPVLRRCALVKGQARRPVRSRAMMVFMISDVPP